MEKSRKFIDAVKGLAYIVCMKATQEAMKYEMKAATILSQSGKLLEVFVHAGRKPNMIFNGSHVVYSMQPNSPYVMTVDKANVIYK